MGGEEKAGIPGRGTCSLSRGGIHVGLRHAWLDGTGGIRLCRLGLWAAEGQETELGFQAMDKAVSPLSSWALKKKGGSNVADGSAVGSPPCLAGLPPHWRGHGLGRKLLPGSWSSLCLQSTMWAQVVQCVS